MAEGARAQPRIDADQQQPGVVDDDVLKGRHGGRWRLGAGSRFRMLHARAAGRRRGTQPPRARPDTSAVRSLLREPKPPYDDEDEEETPAAPGRRSERC